MWWSRVKLHNLITQVSSIWPHRCIFPVHTGKMSSRLCYSGRIVLQIILLGFFLHFFGLPAIERFQAKKVKDDTCILFESESNIFLSIISLRKIHVQTLQTRAVSVRGRAAHSGAGRAARYWGEGDAGGGGAAPLRNCRSNIWPTCLQSMQIQTQRQCSSSRRWLLRAA